MKAQKSIEINAVPEKIWPFFVEPEKVLQWCITFKKFEYTGEKHVGTGTPLYIEEDAGTGLMKMNFEVTEWKEHEKFAMKMLSGGSLKAYDQCWSLEAIPSGSRFTFTENITLPMGILGRFIGFFAEKGSAATLEKMLPRLKALAEA